MPTATGHEHFIVSLEWGDNAKDLPANTDVDGTIEILASVDEAFCISAGSTLAAFHSALAAGTAVVRVRAALPDPGATLQEEVVVYSALIGYPPDASLFPNLTGALGAGGAVFN